MKKIAIYYFSGTGNTWWISNVLQKQLSLLNHQVTCYSIETLTAEDVSEQTENLDHIVFGFPVYGSTAPRLMLDFIHNFPTSSVLNQTVSVFATQALASGDTSYYISKLLTKKGYDVKQAIHFRMMNNLHIPRFRFYPPKNGEPVMKLHQKTLPKVKKLAQAITYDKRLVSGNNLLGFSLGYLQRSHVDQLIATASRDFEVEQSRCIQCNKCQRICPTQNIKKINDVYQFGENCLLCMRCYSQCPKHAILIGKDSIDERKYPRYKGPAPSFDIHVLTK